MSGSPEVPPLESSCSDLELVALDDHGSTRGPCRNLVLRLVTHTSFDLMIGILLLVQLAVAVLETDLQALGKETPGWITIVNYILLGVYSLEIVLRAFALRSKFSSQSPWNVFDCFVVGTDILVTVTSEAAGQFPSVTVLRVFRLVSKLSRMARAVRMFRELHQLLYLMGGALRTLASAFVLLSMFFTIFSLAAVEFIQPIVVDLAREGHYDSCDRCARAFKSVIQANLTWFQVIIMGDGWGTYLTPIIERSPAAGIFFIVVTVTVAFGLMNILMSVIVSKAEDARREDHQLQLADKMHAYDAAKKRLMKICKKLDSDSDGNLTLEDLKHGLEKNRRFREYLSVLDVEESQLNVLFEVLDGDQSGMVAYEEFILNLHKMKADDSHTLLVFIKHFCQDIRLKMKQEIGMVKEEMARLDEIKEFVSETLTLELNRHHERLGENTSRFDAGVSVAGPEKSEGADADLDNMPSEDNAAHIRTTQTPCSGVQEEAMDVIKMKTGGTWNALPNAPSCNNGTQTDNSFLHRKDSGFSESTLQELFAGTHDLQDTQFAPTAYATSSWRSLSCPTCHQDFLQRLGDGALVPIASKAEEKETAKTLITTCPQPPKSIPTSASASFFAARAVGSTSSVLQGSLSL